MKDSDFSWTRRRLLGAAGVAGLWLAAPPPALAQGAVPVVIRAVAGSRALRAGAAETPVAMLQRVGGEPMQFKRGTDLAVTFENALAQPAMLNWHGLGGTAEIEPLLARRPVSAGGKDGFVIPLRSAGTFMFDIRLLSDPKGGPLPAQALVVTEPDPVGTDRNEPLLIEDWRLGSDGRALAPGADAKDATTHYTVNGKVAPEIPVRTQERLRLRLINACQRNIIAVRFDDHEVRVMALDGQPSEPFLARNGTVVLAPGTRIDIFVDATRSPGSAASITLQDGSGAPRPIARLVYSDAAAVRAAPLPAAAPLPGNGLPSQLDLKSAQRIDLPLGAAAGSPPDWSQTADFVATSAPAFQAKRGRTVVLALANRGARPMIFHLHGHHFRLLDRLDDGWKPFWLDTLAIDAGQTQRIAFAPAFAGLWLMEAMAADWASPRLLRSYLVA